MSRSRLRGLLNAHDRCATGAAANKDKNMIAKSLAAIRRWMRNRSNLRVLAALDDHLLDDIGLARADLGRSSSRFWRWYRI
jgi:uncharacterized protein YjiS (DUF1127 family)